MSDVAFENYSLVLSRACVTFHTPPSPFRIRRPMDVAITLLSSNYRTQIIIDLSTSSVTIHRTNYLRPQTRNILETCKIRILREEKRQVWKVWLRAAPGSRSVSLGVAEDTPTAAPCPLMSCLRTPQRAAPRSTLAHTPQDSQDTDDQYRTKARRGGPHAPGG